MKKILLLGLTVALGGLCSWAESVTEESKPVIEGYELHQLTSTDDLMEGDYIIRVHNGRWAKDRYLMMDNKVTKAYEPSAITDWSKATVHITHPGWTNLGTPSSTNGCFTQPASFTSCYAGAIGNMLIETLSGTSVAGKNSGNAGYYFKIGEVNTIAADNSHTTYYEEIPEENGNFFVLVASSTRYVVLHDADNSGVSTIATSGYSNPFYNLVGVAAAHQNTYKDHCITPFFVFYKLVPKDPEEAKNTCQAVYTQTINHYNTIKTNSDQFTEDYWATIEAKKTEIENAWGVAAANFDVDAFPTLCSELEALIAALPEHINPVLPGRYIRIDGWHTDAAKYYLGMPAPDAASQIASYVEDETNSIYYYSPDKHLVNYQYGRALKLNGTFLNVPMTNDEHKNMADAAEVTFYGAYAITNANVLGRYHVTFPSGDDNQPYGIAYTYADRRVGNGKRVSIENVAVLNEPRWTFSISYVDKLPVEIHSGDKCGTVYLPVEVTVPSTHTVYTATEQEVNNEVVLKLTEKTDRVIPAYTHAIITGNAGTIEVEINYAATAAAATASDHLQGNHVTLPIDETDELVPMVKDSSAAAEAAALTDGDEIPAANFVRATEIPANAMVLKVAPGAVTDNEPFSVPLSETSSAYLTKSGTTGISKVMVEGADGSVRIFDLSGRELSAPAKGINIIGGKKVLVK